MSHLLQVDRSMSIDPSARQEFDQRLAHVLEELPGELAFSTVHVPILDERLHRLLLAHRAEAEYFENQEQDPEDEELVQRNWSELYETALSVIGRRIADAFLADVVRGTNPEQALRLAGMRSAAVWERVNAANDVAWLSSNLGWSTQYHTTRDVQKKLDRLWKVAEAVRRGDARTALRQLLRLQNEYSLVAFEPLLQLQAKQTIERRLATTDNDSLLLARRITTVARRKGGARSRAECEQLRDALHAVQHRLVYDPWWRVLRAVAPVLDSMPPLPFMPLTFAEDLAAFEAVWQRLDALTDELNELCLAPQQWLRLYKPQLDRDYLWSLEDKPTSRREDLPPRRSKRQRVGES